MPRFLIPMPLQVVVDDVGWWSGEDGSARREPFRTGMPRPHVPADYQALADLGRLTGTRPVAAFMLGEWDRWNLLRTLPSATWMGAAWDNSRWNGPWLDEAAAIIRRDSAHFELALHGLCHEYWDWSGPDRGAMSRAEWFTLESAMRPVAEIRNHLAAWFELWDRHDLGPRPRLFVPCAFLYHTGLGDAGMAPLLRQAGIAALSTPFKRLGHTGPRPDGPFFFDQGLLMLDRTQNDIPWRQVGPPPEDYAVRGPTLGLHWPQLLHADPARNGEAVDAWVRLLKRAAEQPDRMLAPDSARYIDQLLHHAFTRLAGSSDCLTLDATAFFAQPGAPRRTTVYLKAESATPRFADPDVTVTGRLAALTLTAEAPVRSIRILT
jgi:hypothetical protein